MKRVLVNYSLVYALVFVLGTCRCFQQSFAEPIQQSAKDRTVGISERNHLNHQALKLQVEGRWGETIATLEKLLALERAGPGPLALEAGETLQRLAELYAYQGNFVAARKAGRDALALLTKLQGAESWQAAQARQTAKQVVQMIAMHPEQRRQVAEADQLSRQVVALYSRGEPRPAVALAEKALALRKGLLGENHPDYAAALNNQAALQHAMGDYKRSEPLYRQALEIFGKAQGEKHPDYATILNNLAIVYALRGDYHRAEPRYRQALDLRRKLLGKNHPDSVRSLNNLGWLHRVRGECALAERCYVEALNAHRQGLVRGRSNPSLLEMYRLLDFRRPAQGEMHPDHVLILTNLAVLYNDELGDYARSEPLYHKALEIAKEVLGEDHPDYTRALNNLGVVYQSMGDDARAEPLYKKAVESRKKALGDKHPDYATSLFALGHFYQVVGDYDQAELIYKEAGRIRKEVLGRDHPYYGYVMVRLAQVYQQKGDYAQAEPLYREAFDLRMKKVKETHPFNATILAELGTLYLAMADYDQAESVLLKSQEMTKQAVGENNPGYAKVLYYRALLHLGKNQAGQGEKLARQAVDISRGLMERCAYIQSERQQLRMAATSRYFLDGYLTLAAAKATAEEVYGQVLAWKGAVTIRQQAIRRLRRALTKEGKPEALAHYHDLEQATRRLAALSQMASNPDRRANLRQELERLSAKIEQLERVLSRLSGEFRKGREQQQRTPADIARVIPADAVLIDLLEFERRASPGAKKGTPASVRCLIAFVVKKDKPVAMVDLGPVKPIAEAVDAWRRNFGRATKAGDPGAQLRRLVWDKLEPHAQLARVVLISPDGTVARFPWPALPGKKPGTFLVEERAVAVVPVPAQLPELLAGEMETGSPRSLLVVGDINFDGLPGTATELALARSAPHASRSGSPLHWSRLPGTQAEILAIEKTFRSRFANGKVTNLRQEGATEDEVRLQAPRHQFLHFATHGFFAPPQARLPVHGRSGPDKRGAASVLFPDDVAGFHPGLLSGLVLAGANQLVQPDRDDGILTALEVAELDLGGVELATLSACETGLGETAGGEGLLGLQRSFQIAGAHTVVAGLWKVPDRATQVLMQRFYQNLWEKKLGKLQALGEAQLWMLREGRRSPEILRGLERLPDEKNPRKDGRLPPYYWAAFVLSGDWR